MRVVSSALHRALRGPAVALLALSIVTCHSDTGPSATQLTFTVQPTSTVAGTPFSVTVQAQDNNGTLVTSYAENVTISLATAPTGGTLSGTVSVAAVNGVATFTGLGLTKSGGYTLQAASSGLVGATSAGFSIAPGPAAALTFTTQPGNATAGATITATVTARDQYGNTASSFSGVGGSVQMALQANPGSATLTGTTTVQSSAGIAAFTNLHVDKVGAGYTLIASATGGAPPAAATSNTFNITPGAAAKLAFTVQPPNGAAGTALSPAIQVTAQDAQGNTTPTFTGNVTIAIGVNPGSATLSGGAPVAAVAGVATFGSLTLDKPGTGYTLTASATGLAGATSATFNVTVGQLAQLVFSTQPTTTAAGATISPAVRITGQDAAGNTVTTFTGNVTVAFGNNIGNGTLGGTLTHAAVAGVASFNDLTIDKIGTGYTLNATSGGVPQVTSAAFNITAAVAAQLKFSVQPTNTAAGSAITPAVVVQALDQFGNLASGFNGNVTVAIGTNANSGTLSGTKTNGAANGVATFSTLSIDSAGTGYTLTATAAGLTDGTSSTFDIVPGAATHLGFAQQPTNTTAGAAIAPAVTVRALDAQGNVATAFAGPVAVAIGTNAGSGTLSGTASVAAVNGVATFSDLSIDKSGTGYTLTASSGSLTDATSAAFTVIAGAATQLVFSVQPVNTAAGAAITPAVQVAARDALGNTDLTYIANVTLAIGSNPGSGTLTGGGPVAAVAGVATFAASIDKVGTGYTLTASSGGLTSATSSSFNVFANTATHLVFSVQPTTAVAGVAISPAVVVQALDASNNVATTFAGGVTIAIGTNAGGGTLSGTTSTPAASGVATFSTLNIDKTGDNYTLTATAGGLPVATSGTFNITPAAATRLAFSVEPANTTAGVAIAPAVKVQALDAFGNVATAYGANIDIAIGTNAGGGTLSGTTPIAATNGVATFSDLSINKSGVGYTLHATSGSLTDVTSTPFTIGAATLSQLVFTTQPSNSAAGAAITPAVVVEGQDAFGNKLTTFTGDVTLAIGTNPPTNGVLSGVVTQTAVGGDATFSNLSIDKAGSGYTLTASTTGATGTSAAFNISAGPATMLVFTVQPGASTTAGTAISPPITVAAQDAQGNTDPTFAGNVTIAIGTNGGSPTPGTLSGTKTTTASNGVATFSNLSIDKSGTGYTLTATSSPLTAATSGAFAITAGSATKLAFTVQPPPSTTAGQGIAPSIQVAAQDALGNADPSYATDITLAITGGTGTANATLTGTASQTPANGVATFSGLSIDSAGTSYTLTATSGGLSQAVSTGFDILAGTATQLVITQQPTSAVAGNAIAPTVTVVARDALGNRDPNYASSVTMELVNNAGSPVPGTLSGATAAAAAGVASFPTLSIDKVGTGYTIRATDGAINSAASTAFNITPGPATQLAFSVQPSDATVGATISPAVKVTALDANGNVATNYASNVTLALASGAGNLNGTVNMAAVAGVARFSTLSIDATGLHTLQAASGVLPPALSSAFNIDASVETQLAFNGQPNTTTAGATISTATVEARDASGQLVTTFTGDVTLAIQSGTGTPGAVLLGTTTVTAAGGVATFSDLHIDVAGTNYQLTATSGTLTSATSKFFSINSGAADHLVFGVQPSTVTRLAPITPAIEVVAQDALNNTATSFTGSVTVTLNPNGNTGVLTGTIPVNAVKGVASFSDLSVDAAGNGYTLTADGGLASTVTSTAFDVTASTANHLAFKQQPTSSTAGQAIAPAIVVVALDAANDTLTGFTGDVTLTIKAGSGTNGATLSGTRTVTAVNGMATFNDLIIDLAGSGYRLTATAATLAGTTSTTFAIAPGAATHLAFTTDPVTTTAGGTMPTVTVTALDDFGNTDATFVGDVALGIAVNPGGGTLSGTTTVTASGGVANFTTLSIDKAGVGYELQAGSGALTPGVSDAFSINGGAATHLVFTVAPTGAAAGNGTVGGNISNPHIRVAAYDAFDNVDKTFIDNVTLAITSGTGTAGATLGGTATVAAASGVAEFATPLGIDLVGTGYTLTATTPATGITGTTSATFNITPGPANKLGFVVQPSNTAANTPIAPPVQVAVQDQFGNTVTSSTAQVTMAIGTDGSGASATLGGTKVVNAASGVATFSNLTINNVGTGYTLLATSGSLVQTLSAAFNIF
jgi:hypothetical protein